MDIVYLNWYDFLSLILLLINIFGTCFILYNSKRCKYCNIAGKPLTLTKFLLRGIALIEVIFFLSLYKYLSLRTGTFTNVLDSLPLLLLIIGQITKSIFFLLLLILIAQWLSIQKERYGVQL